MTNTLPGEWTQLVSRANSDDDVIEGRVRDFAKLDRTEQQDVVRGLLVLLANMADPSGDPDVPELARVVSLDHTTDLYFAHLRTIMDELS